MAYEAPDQRGRKEAAFGAVKGTIKAIPGSTKAIIAATAATPVPGARLLAAGMLMSAAISGGAKGYEEAKAKRLGEINERAAKEDAKALKASKPRLVAGQKQKPIAPSDDQVLTDSFGGGTVYDRHQKQTFG